MSGRVHSELGQYRKACNELKKGFDLEPLPQIAYNLANNLILAGEAVLSIPYLEFFLKGNPGRQDVEKKLESARHIKQIAAEMDLSPDSAELYIHMAYRKDPRNELLNQIFPDLQDQSDQF